MCEPVSATQATQRLSSPLGMGQGWVFVYRDFREKQTRPLPSEVTNSNEPLGPQDLNRSVQVPVAGDEQRCRLRTGKFVRCQVAPFPVEERQ